MRIDSIADTGQNWAGFDARRAKFPCRSGVFGIQRGKLRLVVEHRATVAIDERFGWRAFREDHSVLVQFDKEVADRIDLRASRGQSATFPYQ